MPADFLGWNVICLSAKEISGGMLQRAPYNLNALSHDTAEALIRQALADGVNLKRVYIDTVGDPERYEAKMRCVHGVLATSADEINVFQTDVALHPAVPNFLA